MRLIAILFATLTLVACATGTPFKWDQARQVKVGMTAEQVTALMGNPYLVRSDANGVTRYVWTEVNSLTFATKTYSIDFRDGKVVVAPEIPPSF